MKIYHYTNAFGLWRILPNVEIGKDWGGYWDNYQERFVICLKWLRWSLDFEFQKKK